MNLVIKRIAIILILGTFIASLNDKIFDFNNSLIGIQNKGIPFPLLALLGAISFQLIGITGITLKELGNKNYYLKYSKFFLIVFTLLATYFYHNIFYQENQEINFLKNMGLIGGLLLIN